MIYDYSDPTKPVLNILWFILDKGGFRSKYFDYRRKQQ